MVPSPGPLYACRRFGPAPGASSRRTEIQSMKSPVRVTGAVTAIPESAGTLESLTGFDERLAREIVEAAIHRYLAAAHERIAPFVDAHFSFPGAYDLHRRAIGRDLARAPTNVVLAVPRLLLQMGSWSARRAGWDRGDRLGKWEQKLILKTDVARELEWLIRTELLQLPYREEHPPLTGKQPAMPWPRRCSPIRE